jgi:alkanesulfonate monooxygenase SsuD/methylene tetrahydromethanopterin reductase-like flavin-dependent oxidoreductase (luciferase family)
VGRRSRALRRAAERGDGWLPQGTPRDEMPGQIAFLLEHRKQTLGDEPIDLGTITEYLYVGDPGWDVGDKTLSGSPDQLVEQLNAFGAMGVSHLQVRFRNRVAPGAPRPDGRLPPRRRPAPAALGTAHGWTVS